MRDGFIKVAAVTPEIRVAECGYNTDEICRMIGQAYEEKVKIMVFPELCITGYTCQDLFWQEKLLEESRQGLKKVVEFTRGMKALLFVGLPWEAEGKIGRAHV